MEPSQIYDYGCGFCLNIVKAELRKQPDECPSCKIGKCTNCHTYLKSGSFFCYGCGKLEPEIKSHFLRTDSTACFYSEQAWIERNLGNNCEYHMLVTSCEPNMPKNYIGVRDAEIHKIKMLRPLTEEEVKAIREKDSNISG